jgi:hypothetical protein
MKIIAIENDSSVLNIIEELVKKYSEEAKAKYK